MYRFDFLRRNIVCNNVQALRQHPTQQESLLQGLDEQMSSLQGRARE